MTLRPADFALNDAKWNMLVAMNDAVANGKDYVLVNLKTKQARALDEADLDPFGGMPELEDASCSES